MRRSARARSISTSRQSALAVVLCAGGLLLLLAGWKLADGHATGNVPQAESRWLALAVALALALVVAVRRVPGYRPAARTASLRTFTLLAVMVTLAATGHAAVTATRRFDDGFPSLVANLGVLGGLAVLFGLMVSLGIPRPARRPVATAGIRRRVRSARRGALLAGAVTAVLLGSLVTGVVSTSDRWTVRSVTVSAKAVPAVPPGVSKVGWTARLPSPAREVVRAGTGAAVLVDDGVLGIDGARGAVWWSYRRLGSSARWLSASPDGATVAVALSPSGGHRWDTVLILDALTGRLRAGLADGTVRTRDGAALLTDDVLVAPSTDGLAYRAYALADGRLAWTWLPPPGCRLDSRRGIAALRHELLVALACPAAEALPAQARLVRLDAVTGTVRAEQRVVADFDEGRLPTVEVAPDHRLALVRLIGAAPGQQHLHLFDPATGEFRPAPVELGALLPGGLAAAVRDPAVSEQLLDARTGQRRNDPALFADCARAGVLLEVSALCGAAPLGASRTAIAARSGLLALVTAPLGAQVAVELPIDFGQRAEVPVAGSTGYTVANGAVIVYLRTPAAPGVADTIVGLQ